MQRFARQPVRLLPAGAGFPEEAASSRALLFPQQASILHPWIAPRAVFVPELRGSEPLHVKLPQLERLEIPSHDVCVGLTGQPQLQLCVGMVLYPTKLLLGHAMASACDDLRIKTTF